ncbi:MAG: App1 family protein [Verrucomicrobia bacterium]|nr:App1 family protein [Verrucomicrobiota bacterium]
MRRALETAVSFRRSLVRLVVMALLIGCPALRAAVSADETVLLYPALARSAPGGWEVQWSGIIYEQEKRAATSFLTRQLFGLSGFEMSTDEAAIFAERSRLFMVDNERRKTIRVRLGNDSWAMGRSGANGRFGTRQFLSSNLVQTAWFAGPQRINIPLVVEASDGRIVNAEVHVIGEDGWSVVSDIDDTIKISDVLNREALLKNTFCRPFAVVPGMSEMYRQWAEEHGAVFHYVSASPWQLYLPLSEFVRSNGFPAGTFHMKDFRLKDRTAAAMLASPEKYKPGVIEPLLRQFPRRQFVLVGDSGEKDPEIYAQLARRFPKQVRAVFIRDVTGEEASAPRYQKVFSGVGTNRWWIFRDPAEIRPLMGGGGVLLPKRD